MSTTIQIRIDEKTKKEAKKVFESLGLNMSEAVKLYLKSVIETKTIPFVLTKNKKLKKEVEERLAKEAEEALKYGKRYDNLDELFKDLGI